MQDRLSPVNVLHARMTRMEASTDVPILETLMNVVFRPNRIDIYLQNTSNPGLITASAWHHA